jgi:hypothetical protein
VRVGSATRTRPPSCSTTTSTICQRSAAAPSDSATTAPPACHASVIRRGPEDSCAHLHQKPGRANLDLASTPAPGRRSARGGARPRFPACGRRP